MSDLDQDPGGVEAVLLDGVVQRCLVLDILGVNIGALTFVCCTFGEDIYSQPTCLMRKSTSSELWTLLIRQVPPKWFARWMLAPAPTRALMMARWLQEVL